MRQPRVFHLLQLAHSALFRAADRALQTNVGLTASQQAVLFVLMQRDGAPITAIADQLRMGKSSLTGLIDRMSAKGLVTRRQSPSDARSFEVFIEDAGRHLVHATLASTKKINASLLKPFSSDECAVIERFLKHVSENAEEIVIAQTASLLRERKAS